MLSNPARLDPGQLAASVLAVLVAASLCGFLVFRRRVSRASAYRLLCACAWLAVASWLRFGELHVLYVDPGTAPAGERPARVEQHHRLFQYHELFHYYMGAKYFRELGYLGLYDCTALADQEIAAEDRGRPRIEGFVRDLDDVLADKPVAAALADCRERVLPRFSPARWRSFRGDVRELQRLLPDEAWNEVVNDKGFNPPPSFVLLAGALANVVPIRAGGAPTYLLITSIDLVLLVACFAALRKSLGATAAALAAVYFGATFLAGFGWLGGAFLRFTWVAAVVLSLWALRRGRWALAGALLAWAACERLFPVGFAAGAVVSVALRSPRSARHRAMLARFGVAFAATVLVLVAASAAVFGASAWSVFSARALRDVHVHNVLHIGLEKILAYRSWMPFQDFGGHAGFLRFARWNLRITDTWRRMQPLAVPLQIAALLAAAAASARRPPFEGAVLCGVVLMFVLTAPASYYFVILAVVPAVLFRSAATATSEGRRFREYVALTAFNAFWMGTLLAPRLWPDVVLHDLAICVAFAAFLVIWIAAWMRWPVRRRPVRETPF